MKNHLFLALLFVGFGFTVEATHFQSTMSITPVNDKNEYAVNMQIFKVTDATCSELVAAPKMLCVPGEPTLLTIESEDKADLLSIEATVLDSPNQKILHASVLMKEKEQVVLSFEHEIQVNP